MAHRQITSTTFQTDMAPGLRHWRIHGTRVAKLALVFPPLFQRMSFAPPQAFHAYVIYLYLHDASKDSEKTARYIYETPPKRLIEDCLPDADTRLFAILRQCGNEAHPVDFYDNLCDLMHHPEISQSLVEATSIDQALVNFLMRAKAWNLDPLVIAAQYALRHKPKRAVAFHDLVQCCRLLGVIEDNAVEIVRIKKSEKLSELVEGWLQKCVTPYNFP